MSQCDCSSTLSPGCTCIWMRFYLLNCQVIKIADISSVSCQEPANKTERVCAKSIYAKISGQIRSMYNAYLN